MYAHFKDILGFRLNYEFFNTFGSLFFEFYNATLRLLYTYIQYM